jgi:signal recognition particle subunit SRP54
MVLSELANKLQAALNRMKNKTIINKEVIEELLKDITNTLMESDISFALIKQLRINLMKKLLGENMNFSGNKRVIIERAVHEELCKMLDPGVEIFKPSKFKQHVVMFVGLQGAGKTTTVSKYANHYKKKGFRPALICADTFRAGAFAQLQQNAARAKIPFHGDVNEGNPVQIAKEGVEKFKEAGMQLIIVDTSGRHHQAEGLFREMEEIRAVINPDIVILVMDGAMGQSAADHAEAFKRSVDVGGIIITKLDDRNAKGGAALSAVVSTHSPILFIGTGEHMDDLDEFEPQSFASQLLGMANIPKVLEFVKENIREQPSKEDMIRLQTGEFSFRDFQKQLDNFKDMPINKFVGMLGINSNLGEEDGKAKLKSMMVILDSMTNNELDNAEFLTTHKTRKSRIDRISRGSGRSIAEVNQLLESFKQLKTALKMATKMTRNKGGMASQMGKVQKMMSGMGMGNIPNIANLKGLMNNMNLGGLGNSDS